MQLSKSALALGAVILLGAGCAKAPAPANTADTKSPDTAVTTPAASITLKEGLYGANPELSKVTWSGKKRVLPAAHTGTVTLKEGEFFIKDGKPFIGEVVMDMSTITSDENIEALVKHLKAPDFFDIEKYPTATFRNKNTVVVDAGAGRYDLEGDMIIRGISVPTTVQATFTPDESGSRYAIRAKAVITLDRTLFDMKFGSEKFFENLGDKLVEDTFTITVDVHFD